MEKQSILINNFLQFFDRDQISGFEIGCMIVVTIIILILITYLIISNKKRFIKLYELNNSAFKWPKAMGVIMQSELQDGSAFETIAWNHLFEYSFMINGVEFRSNNITFFDNSAYFDKADCIKAIEKYPVNSFVQVRYNPMNPKECCLYPQKNKTSSRSFIKNGIVWFLTFLILLIIALIPIAISYGLILSGKLLFQLFTFGCWAVVILLIIYTKTNKFDDN